jgi:hypothetical protein
VTAQQLSLRGKQQKATESQMKKTKTRCKLSAEALSPSLGYVTAQQLSRKHRKDQQAATPLSCDDNVLSASDTAEPLDNQQLSVPTIW